MPPSGNRGVPGQLCRCAGADELVADTGQRRGVRSPHIASLAITAWLDTRRAGHERPKSSAVGSPTAGSGALRSITRQRSLTSRSRWIETCGMAGRGDDGTTLLRSAVTATDSAREARVTASTIEQHPP